jgi:predicted acyltransferase
MDIIVKESFHKNQPRLLSLDVLRGFDMFWIIGGGTLIQILAKCFPSKWLQLVADQMEHAKWVGFHFYDLIFPLFMFISGATIPIAIILKLERGTSKKDLLIKVTKRMVILIILGFVYNGILRDGFANARYASILAQIGVSYFIASLIVIYSHSVKSQLLWLGGILVGFGIIQLLIPVPGIGAGVLTPEGCINGYVDRILLPGRLAYGPDGMSVSGNGIFDALGILSILSATGVTLMGYFAGRILLQKDYNERKKLSILSILGIGLIFLALCLSPFYPIIKKCWTSTYNLFSGGISFILIALFYLVIDVWGYKKWTLFFRVIGMNSIFAYIVVAGNLVNVYSTSISLFGWIASPLSENGGQIVLTIGNILLAWLLLYFMFCKNIFIKV